MATSCLLPLQQRHNVTKSFWKSSKADMTTVELSAVALKGREKMADEDANDNEHGKRTIPQKMKKGRCQRRWVPRSPPSRGTPPAAA